MEGYQNGPSWPQECPFSDVGCTVSLCSASEYQAHLSKNTDRHLRMITDFHHKTITGETHTSGAVITDFHHKTITGETHTSGAVNREKQPEETTKDHNEDVQSDKPALSDSIGKLTAIESEVEFLTDVLSGYGISQLPALECIKTQLKLPEVGITTFGDSCTFRMVNISQHRETGQKWLSPHFFVRGGHKMCLAVYPNGLGSGEGTHLSLKLLLLFDDQLEWPISLPSHLGIRVELLIESEGLFEEADSTFDEGPITATRAPSAYNHHLEFTWKPRGERKSSSSSPSPKSTAPKSSLLPDKRYSLRKATAPSLVRRASFNEKSSRKIISSEESQQRLSRILPPWCQQPSQPRASEISTSNGTDSDRQENLKMSRAKIKSNETDELTSSSHEEEKSKKSEGQDSKRDKKGVKVGEKELSKNRDGVDGATVFSMEKFATYDQIDKYTQEYNSLVFQITLCLV